MPREIGLGDSLGDEDIDGDIDFDFFEEGRGGGDSNRDESSSKSTSTTTAQLRIGDAGDGVTTLKPAPAEQHQATTVEDRKSVVVIHQILTNSDAAVFPKTKCASNEDCDNEECVSQVLNAKSSASNPFSTDNDDRDFVSSMASEATVESVFDGVVALSPHHQLIRGYRSGLQVESDSDDSEADGDRDGDDEESDNSLDVTVTESDSSVLSDDSLDNLSDSEITDVTPMSSTNNSPLPASPNRLANRKLYGNSGLPLRKRESVKFVDNVNINGTVEGRSRHSSNSSAYDSSGGGVKPGIVNGGSSSVDLNLLVEAILEMERDRKRKLMSSPSSNPALFVDRPMSSRSRKNMSFSNDQVRKIDRENHILLKKILDSKQNVSRPTSANPRVLAKPASSAINRLRQQKKIEAENLLLLKRIQSAKPTKELSRTYLLKSQQDHIRVSHSLPVSRSVSQASFLKYNGARRTDVPSSATPSLSSRLHSRSHSANSTPTSLQNGHSGPSSSTKHTPHHHQHKLSRSADSARPEMNSPEQAKI